MRHWGMGNCQKLVTSKPPQTPICLPYLWRASRWQDDLAVVDWLTVADCLQIFDNSALSSRTRIGPEQAFAIVESLPQEAD